MRRKFFIGAALAVSALAVSTLAGASMSTARRQALVHFTRPTVIAGAFVLGHVVIEHDDDKMARGEACTTVYNYDRKARLGQGKPIVAFHCNPSARPAAQAPKVRSEVSPTGLGRLIEYQLTGELEAHGVPAGR